MTEIYHADYDEDNPLIASNEPIIIPDSEIVKLFEKPEVRPKANLWRILRIIINRFFWKLKHRIVIELQLRTNNTNLYNKLVALRKSWGAY